MITVQEIAKKTNRSKESVQGIIYRLDIKPIRTDINGIMKFNYYSEESANKILNKIEEINTKSKRPNFNIIYVTRSTEIYQSKLNFLPLSRL